MAESADVIELGSSDEEPEPAAKKPKRLNAMVSIPDSLPDISIMKKMPVQHQSSRKVSVAPSVQNLIKNPFAAKHLQATKKFVNGKPTKIHPRNTQIQSVCMPIRVNKTIQNSNKIIIPKNTGKVNKHLVMSKNVMPATNLVNVKKLTKSNTLVNTTNLVNTSSIVTATDMARAKNLLQNLHAGTGPHFKNAKMPQLAMSSNVRLPVSGCIPVIVGKPISLLPVTSQSPPAQRQKGLTSLPPGITVTRVSGQQKRRRVKRPPSPAKVTFKKQKLDSAKTSEVLTVELDDDDEPQSQPTTASPQWYLRPEDTVKPKESEPKVTVEAENNEEPEESGKKMIEITIEDSPVKPPPIIHMTKMASDLSVIIEDSPQKGNEVAHTGENMDNATSDEECNEVSKVRHSRKKLDFPKKTAELIEVEVEFCNPAPDAPESTEAEIEANNRKSTKSTEKNTKNVPSHSLKPHQESHTSLKLSEETVENESLEVNKKEDTSPKVSKQKDKVSPKDSKSQNKTNSHIVSKNKDQDIISTATKSQDPMTIDSKSKNQDSMPSTSKSKDADTTQIASTNKYPDMALSANKVDDPDSMANSRKIKDSDLVPSISKQKDPGSSTSKSKERDEVPDSNKTKDPVPSTSKINDRNLPIDSKSRGAGPLPNTSKTNDIPGEFGETYQMFINLCFEMEDSEDMKKIVEKKVKEYYRQVNRSFTNSEGFIELVSSKIEAMKSNPENLYLYIKDIVDELKMMRKQKGKLDVKEQVVKEKPKETRDEISFADECDEKEMSDRTSRNIRKLEKTLRKLHRSIQKLEEQEVDFDDDTDSVYLLTERYKERLIRVHAKLCHLTGTKLPSESKISLERRAGRPEGPTLKLENWINKKVPMGTPLPFPDFHDVVRCVKEANIEDNLGWTDLEIMEESRDLFSRCGKQLQKRRQKNEWRIASSRIGVNVDPAIESSELKQKLEENKKIAAKKETEVINKYVDRQNLLKLEGKEIDETEMEDSAPSSDDEVQAVEEDKIISPSQKYDNIYIKPSEPAKEVQSCSIELTTKMEMESKSVSNEIKHANVDILKENGESHRDDDTMGINDATEKITQMKGTDTTKHDNAISNIKDDESDSEQIRLVLSDENSDSGKSNDAIEDTLLRQRSDIETVASTLESSDTDAPIAISDTEESSGDQEPTTKCSEIVSIENSSYSESERNEDNYSSPSKEKQSLLEIDDSEEESKNIENAKIGIEDKNQVILVENKPSSSEKEQNTYDNSNKCPENASIQSPPTNNADVETNVSHTFSNDNLSRTMHESNKSTTPILPKNMTPENESNHKSKLMDGSDLNKHCEDREISTDASGLDNAKEPEMGEILSLDTENSGSLPLSSEDNEPYTLNENQNSDSLDIGPTIIQGVNILSIEYEAPSCSLMKGGGELEELTSFQRSENLKLSEPESVPHTKHILENAPIANCELISETPSDRHTSADEPSPKLPSVKNILPDTFANVSMEVETNSVNAVATKECTLSVSKLISESLNDRKALEGELPTRHQQTEFTKPETKPVTSDAETAGGISNPNSDTVALCVDEKSGTSEVQSTMEIDAIMTPADMQKPLTAQLFI